MNINYKIKSDISEAQIEADVASYLGYVTPFWSARFELLAVDEQVTGADKLFNRFVPIYMQFKVSEGLKPMNFSFLPSNSNLPLQRIRIFRRNNSLPSNPILYFKLRDLAKNATNFQHNSLLQFHSPPSQYAVYVAPLSLEYTAYNQSLQLSFPERLFFWKPFHLMATRIYENNSRHLISILPFLRGHISIPPHKIVSTSDHHYSFSKSGIDIAFHQGETIEGDFRLSTFVSKVYQSFYSSDSVGISKQSYMEVMERYFESNSDYEPISRDLSIDDRIIEFAKHLKKVRGIKLLFLGNEVDR